jgi:hypothetical protein
MILDPHATAPANSGWNRWGEPDLGPSLRLFSVPIEQPRSQVRPKRQVMQRLICLLSLSCGLWIAAARAEPATNPHDLNVILERVLERAQVEEQNYHDFKQLYHFRNIRVREEFDGKGRVTKRKARNGFNTPEPASEPDLAHPEARNDGVPLDSLDERAVAERITSGRAFSRSDFQVDPAMVQRFEFTLVGRDAIAGRPMLVVEFVPSRRQSSTRSLKDRLINQAAGRFWVDEEEWAVARAELRLAEPVSVLGGLVGVLRSFKYELLRERSPEGMWYISQVDWQLKGRLLLANKVVVHHEHKEDVRLVSGNTGGF